MMYARLGWHIQDIAFLGRWKSSAVFRYVEQELQEVPVNVRAPRNEPQGTTTATEKRVVVVKEKTNTKMTERLEAAEAKVLEVNGRLEALEQSEAKVLEVNGRLEALEQFQGKAVVDLDDPPGILWALSKSRSGKVGHVVKQASWNLPLQEWATSCGWKFARRNVKVELTRNPHCSIRKCGKCQELEQLRDKVSSGVGLAQLVEI